MSEQAARLRFASQLVAAVEPSITAARRLAEAYGPALAVARNVTEPFARFGDTRR